MTLADVAKRLSALLGPPGPAGWRLVFPEDGHAVTISLRSGFGHGGAVWFEEPFEDRQRSWWIPMSLPHAVERVAREVEIMIGEGAMATVTRS